MKESVHRFRIIVIVLVSLSIGSIQSLNAQNTAVTEEDATLNGEDSDSLLGEEHPVPQEEPQTPEQLVLEMDIKTSSLAELVAWCRSLGLSEGGTKEELANRLRTYYKISAAGKMEEPRETKKQRTITIESSRSTEYFTLDVVDEEYARLRGNVVISFKDGEAIYRIKAWEVLYNRTRNVMTASRGVEYAKAEGDTIETFKGESITVNLDNWSGIFLDGITERSLSKEETAYRFSGTIISRSDEEVTVMTDATISNAKNEETYWSLNAYKLWLLPGSDWAVLNAVLKVGEIPVLYIPFFYFPADEIIFHPVIGHRSRTGNFVQTTTYLLGRPQVNSASESSFSRIMGNGEDMEKVREGIFLRSTGKKSRDPNDTRLSMLFDAYSNLGFYLGTELSLPKWGILDATDLSAGMGFTRDIYRLTTGYTPFAQYDGSDTWNTSRLFGMDVPFRYRFNTKGSLKGTYGSLTWNVPFYSDIYMDQDFLDRSEVMDWVQMIKGEQEDETTNAAKNLLRSQEWRLNGSLTPSVSSVTPYISSLTISNISHSLAFRTRSSNLISNGVSPNRNFLFPDKLTLYSISTSIAGTPLTLGVPQTAQTPKAEEPQEDPFQGKGTIRSPWETPGEPKVDPSYSTGVDRLVPSVLSQQFNLPRRGGPRFTIDYGLTPTSASELQFRSSQQNWPEAENIDWSEISSILLTFRGDGNIGFTLSQPETSLYTSSIKFSSTGQWQDYTYINEEAEEYTTNRMVDQNKIDNTRLRAYNATFFTTSYEFRTAFKLLYQSPIWGNSNLQYTLKGLLVKSVFDGTGGNPSWNVQYGEWVKKDIDIHQMTINFAASIIDNIQDITIITDMPPRDTTLGGSAAFRAWISETNIRGKILDPWEEDRKFDLIYFTETIKFGTTYPFQFQQQMVYDPELEEYTSLTSSLSWIGLSASFTAARSRTYTLESTGWVQSTEEPRLNPREFQAAYVNTFKKDSLWNKKFSFSFNVNTKLTLDLQRYTYSKFNFSLGFTLGIADFLDLSLGTASENVVVFRYLQNLPFFDLHMEIPGEQNFFIDLFNSFRFDDEALRRSSGFKLKSFKIDLTHHLGDWNARLGVTLTPYLDRESGRVPIYKFNNEISFLVQWVPMSELKADIYHNKDKTVFR